MLFLVFELDGRRYQALNGGMDHPFTEAVSLSIACETQAELDRIWDALLEGGQPVQCGWLKDRFGMSWQVVPASMERLIGSDPAATERVMRALMDMVKLDIAALERAHDGEVAIGG